MSQDQHNVAVGHAGAPQLRAEDVFSLNLVTPQPNPSNTVFKVITVHNYESPQTWTNVLPQMYNSSLVEFRDKYTLHLVSNGDMFLEFPGVVPDNFTAYMVQIDPATGMFVPVTPPSSHGQLVLRPPAAVVDEPPFPSSSTVPERFLFLMHASRTDPRLWPDRAVRTGWTDENSLVEFPGAYFTLVTADNIHTIEPYDCYDCYVAVFALDLLKQRNWHMNLADIHGQTRSNLTFFPWQLNDIAEVAKRKTGFNEVVFHDSVPFAPFLTHVFKITTTPGKPAENDFNVQALQIGRVEIQPGGFVTGLNPSPPRYCWPSFFDTADVGVERNPLWTSAVADACGVDWAATLERNRDFLSKANAADIKRAFQAPLYAQFQLARANPRLQNLNALHRLSLDPSRLTGGARARARNTARFFGFMELHT